MASIMRSTALDLPGALRRAACRLVVLFGLALAGQGALAMAEEFPPGSAHEMVQQVTDELLVAIEEHRPGFDQDQEPFLALIDEMLQDVVDFQWIARNVMGPYFQQASEDQVERFARVFRTSLIETYGQGLMNFSDERIDVLPPRDGQADERRVSVTQHIRSGGNTYPIVYTMVRNRDDEWKVLNVIINGINLGVTFRNQFQQAAQRERGDIERVIEGWSPAVAIELDDDA